MDNFPGIFLWFFHAYIFSLLDRRRTSGTGPGPARLFYWKTFAKMCYFLYGKLVCVVGTLKSDTSYAQPNLYCIGVSLTHTEKKKKNRKNTSFAIRLRGLVAVHCPSRMRGWESSALIRVYGGVDGWVGGCVLVWGKKTCRSEITATWVSWFISVNWCALTQSDIVRSLRRRSVKKSSVKVNLSKTVYSIRQDKRRISSSSQINWHIISI